jgi:hypothetical protein
VTGGETPWRHPFFNRALHLEQSADTQGRLGMSGLLGETLFRVRRADPRNQPGWQKAPTQQMEKWPPSLSKAIGSTG